MYPCSATVRGAEGTQKGAKKEKKRRGAGAETGAGAGTETGAGTGAETGTGAGTRAEMGAGSGT